MKMKIKIKDIGPVKTRKNQNEENLHAIKNKISSENAISNHKMSQRREFERIEGEEEGVPHRPDVLLLTANLPFKERSFAALMGTGGRRG
jgi:hypothetical protein